jgi:hypothetical protein
MSIRFQTQGPRVGYEVVQQQKPGQQLMGLYNTWQSLAPHTRDWITSGFGLFSDEPTDEYGFTEDDYDKNGNIKRSTEDKEKLLDEIGDRETVIPEDEYQSWEGIVPTDIEVGVMDPYGIDDIKPEEPSYKSKEPRKQTKKLLSSIPEVTHPGFGWGLL